MQSFRKAGNKLSEKGHNAREIRELKRRAMLRSGSTNGSPSYRTPRSASFRSPSNRYAPICIDCCDVHLPVAASRPRSDPSLLTSALLCHRFGHVETAPRARLRLPPRKTKPSQPTQAVAEQQVPSKNQARQPHHLQRKKMLGRREWRTPRAL
jgi:hypothetical protein